MLLDVKTDDFVQTIGMHGPVTDTAVLGLDLVLASGDGLKLIALEP